MKTSAYHEGVGNYVPLSKVYLLDQHTIFSFIFLYISWSSFDVLNMLLLNNFWKYFSKPFRVSAISGDFKIQRRDDNESVA